MGNPAFQVDKTPQPQAGNDQTHEPPGKGCLGSAEWLGRGRAQRRNWKTAALLIDSVDGLDEQERHILHSRWLNEARRYDELWHKQRLAYFGLRAPMIIGAATVPVLAGLSVPTGITAVTGLAVAILTGFDGLFRLGERWRQGRVAATTITVEGWRFLELSGDIYGVMERRDAYKLFLSRLEEMNERVSMRRVDIFSEISGTAVARNDR